MQNEKEPSKVYMTDLPDKQRRKAAFCLRGGPSGIGITDCFSPARASLSSARGCSQIAMSWLVYRLTGSAALLGLIGFVAMAPMFFATTALPGFLWTGGTAAGCSS